MLDDMLLSPKNGSPRKRKSSTYERTASFEYKLVEMKNMGSYIYRNYKSPDLREIKATMRLREISQIDERIAIKEQSPVKGVKELDTG